MQLSRFALKMLALLISLLIWWFVNGENNITVKTILVPVDFKEKPSEKVIVSDLNRQIKVTLRGPGFLISKVEASQPVFKVIIPQNVDTKYTATFSKYDLGISPPVEVMDIDPASIDVYFENLIRKEVDVSVPRVGTLNEGLRLESMQVVPEKVTIVGVDSELKGVKKLETESLDMREFGLENAAKPHTRSLHLKVPGKFSSIPSGDQVEVHVQVAAIEISKVFTGIPVEIRSVATELLKISPNKVSVEVAGPKKAVENLGKDQIFPFVRFYPGIQLTDTAGIQVELPKGVSLSKVDPSEVSVVELKEEEKPAAKPKSSAGAAVNKKKQER